ncbi:50S ribosomal protein HLP, mitochondrial-like protein [Tanacetum coccineum]
MVGQRTFCNLTVMRNIMVDDTMSKAKVASMMGRHGWNWPTNIPKVDNMPCPVLDDSKKDVTLWITNEGRMVKYSTRRVWFDLNEKEDEIWEVLKVKMGQNSLSHDWEEIVLTLSSLPCNKNILSITRRLVFGACVYHIWQERNIRLFSDEARDWKKLVNAIINEIRLKLSSLTVKESYQTSLIAERWKVQMNMKKDDETIIEEICCIPKDSLGSSFVLVCFIRKFPALVYEVFYVGLWRLLGGMPAMMMPFLLPILSFCEGCCSKVWKLGSSLGNVVMVGSIHECLLHSSEASLTGNVALCNKVHWNYEFSSFLDDALIHNVGNGTCEGKKGARLGDTIVASLKEAQPGRKVKKGQVVYGVVVRAAMHGSKVKFEDNAVVLFNKQGEPIGTRVFGPVPHELRKKKHVKILSLAQHIA